MQDSLRKILGFITPIAQQVQDQGLPPEITYNPNQSTNIPYSVHDPQLVAPANRYLQNPDAPEFKGVDPSQFGFPADDGAPKELPWVPPVHGYVQNPKQSLNNRGVTFSPLTYGTERINPITPGFNTAMVQPLKPY